MHSGCIGRLPQCKNCEIEYKLAWQYGQNYAVLPHIDKAIEM